MQSKAVKVHCSVAAGMVALMRISAGLVDESPLKQWHTTFGMKVGRDAKLFAKCWCRLYTPVCDAPIAEGDASCTLGRHAAATSATAATAAAAVAAPEAAGGGGGGRGVGGGGVGGAATVVTSSPPPTRMKRNADGILKKAAATIDATVAAAGAVTDHQDTTPAMQTAPQAPPPPPSPSPRAVLAGVLPAVPPAAVRDAAMLVLVVVPDAAVDYWLDRWGDTPVFRITGSDGGDAAGVWARAAREVTRWSNCTPPTSDTGAVLLLDYGRVVHMLAASVTPPNATAAKAQALLRTPGCLIVDEMQLALVQVRRQSKAKVKVIDAVSTIHPQQKVVWVANVAEGSSGDAGHQHHLLKGTATESAEDALAWPIVLAAASKLVPTTSSSQGSTPVALSRRTRASLAASLAACGAPMTTVMVKVEAAPAQECVAEELGPRWQLVGMLGTLFSLHPKLVCHPQTDPQKVWTKGLKVVPRQQGEQQQSAVAPIASPPAECGAGAASAGAGAGVPQTRGETPPTKDQIRELVQKATDAAPLFISDAKDALLRLDVQHSGRLQLLCSTIQTCVERCKQRSGAGAGSVPEIAVFCQLPLSITAIESSLAASAASLAPTSAAEVLPNVAWEVVPPNKNIGMAQASKRQQPKNKARREETAHFRSWLGGTLTDGTQSSIAAAAGLDQGKGHGGGQQICYKYNYTLPDGCFTSNCTDAHVCDVSVCAGAAHPHYACPIIVAEREASAPPDCRVKIYALQSLDGYGDLPTDVTAVIFFDLDCIKHNQPVLATHRQQHALSKTYRVGRTTPLEVYEFC